MAGWEACVMCQAGSLSYFGWGLSRTGLIGAEKRLSSPAVCLGEQLSLRFKPIGLRVAGQTESAPAFGNEIRAEPDCFVWGLRSLSRSRRH